MKPIYHYSTVSEALDELNELGLLTIIIFIRRHYSESNYQVKHVYRYEGNSDQAIQL
jgi:hypothetical protein